MVASRRASVQSVEKKSLSAILDFAIWGRSKTMKSVTSHGAKIVGKNVTVNGCLMKAKQMTKDEGCIPAATSETNKDFVYFRSQKPARFPVAQKYVSTKCQYTFSRQPCHQV